MTVTIASFAVYNFFPLPIQEGLYLCLLLLRMVTGQTSITTFTIPPLAIHQYPQPPPPPLPSIKPTYLRVHPSMLGTILIVAVLI